MHLIKEQGNSNYVELQVLRALDLPSHRLDMEDAGEDETIRDKMVRLGTML